MEDDVLYNNSPVPVKKEDRYKKSARDRGRTQPEEFSHSQQGALPINASSSRTPQLRAFRRQLSEPRAS